MKKFIFYLVFFTVSILFAQEEEIEILGKVVDKITKKGIGEAIVIVYPTGEKTTTQPNGNFYLSIKKQPNLSIHILKSGYETLKITNNFSEIYAEMSLLTQVQGQKITVQAKKDEKRVAISKQSLSQKEIKNTTSSIFEDSIKVVQTLPGVVSLGFSSEMYIRGGDSYEFSSFYDRAYLTNPYVLGGALSVFNPDVVGNIDFYTGGFPAEFANGMSGALDVRMRDGNKEKFKGFGEISITSFLFLIEGPLSYTENNKNSYLFAFRRTYYDLAAKLFFDNLNVQLPYFYDAHLRFTFQLDEKNILRIFSLGVYEGVDIKYEDVGRRESANFKEGSSASFLNVRLLQGFSLTSAISQTLLWENTVSYLYRFADLNFFSDPNRYLKIKPSEHYFQWRSDLTYTPNENHFIKTGFGLYGFIGNLDMEILFRGFPPGFASLYNPPPYLPLTAIPSRYFEEKYRGRLALFPTYYIQDDIQIVPKTLFFKLGFNFQYFNFGKGFIIDPRAGLKLSLEKIADFKLAGGMYSQYPITKEFGRVFDKKYGNPNLKPEKAYHIVFSIEKDWEEFFIRSDVFGKYYKDLVTEDYQYNFVNGEIGRSYGFEFFLQKKIGKDLDGWISYTFVVTQRKIINRTSREEYNLGKPISQQRGEYRLPFNQWYYPEFDRRHSLNIVLNYFFTEKWKLSATFKFGTGTPYTDVIGSNAYGVDTDGNLNTAEQTLYTPIYGPYNQARLKYYMNLDIKLSMPFFWDNWSAYVQILNALNNKNIYGYSYDPTYTEKRASTGIPVPVPIFGIRAEF